MPSLTSSARADAKSEIAAVEASIAAGVEAKNADAIMANYIPGDTLVVFDVIPPLQYKGSEAYKKDWAGVLGGCSSSPKLELTGLDITAEGNLAFGHSTQHFSCKDLKGNKLEFTMRATDCYRKINGKWLIVHEHLSVPVDLATGKADLSSKP
jgi:ketosteroid isomerase-like protein